ncbi:MAG: hypothetical protein WAM14_16245 [Candidatus Nitrosopolaris sp.]
MPRVWLEWPYIVHTAYTNHSVNFKTREKWIGHFGNIVDEHEFEHHIVSYITDVNNLANAPSSDSRTRF